MAQPITWRTIENNNNPAVISNIFDSAGKNLNGGLNALTGIFKDTAAIQDRNMTAIDEAAKGAYLDQLAGAKTPEALAALQASGQLDSARLGLSAASRTAVRGADEARTTALRTNDVAAFDFNNKLLDRTELPQIQAINAEIATGTPESLARAKAMTDSASIRDKSALYTAGHTTARSRLGETRADTLFGQSQETYAHGLEMRPFADAATQRTDTTGEINLAELQRSTKEAARVRSVDDLATRGIAEYQAQKLASRKLVDEGLKGFTSALPRSEDGSLKVEELTTDAISKIKAHLKTTNSASLDSLMKGDTAQVAKLKADLFAAGGKPADIARLEPLLNSGLSTVSAAPVGLEASGIMRNQRIQDATTKMNAAMFTPLVAPGSSETALDIAKTEIDKIHPVGSYRNQNWNEAIANFDGIIATDPKTKKPIMGADGVTPIRVLPGTAAMKQILRGTENSFFGFGKNDIANALKKWAEDPVNQAGAAASVNDTLINSFRQINVEKPAGTK